MTKVHMLTTCSACQGQAYLPAGEAIDYKGKTYLRYIPCPHCEGSGMRPHWISLSEFAEVLKQEQCQHQHTSYQGGFHFSAGDVWDDLAEVCTDCGANLDQECLS